MKITHKEDHMPLRKGNYPDLGEQLDAIYKGFLALQESGFELPKETQDWLVKISNIKSTFKKEQ